MTTTSNSEADDEPTIGDQPFRYRTATARRAKPRRRVRYINTSR